MEGLPRHTPTVRLGELVERVVSSAHDDLVKLASSAPGRAEVDRKRELARYLHTLRQRLTRLAVLAEWAPVQRRARISILCGDMLGQLEQHDRAFADAADRLFGLHQQMAWARAPLFDLPGALDVLCNGEYSALPRAIAEVAPKPARSADDPETERERSDRLNLQARVEREMRSKLLDEKRSGSLPEGVKIWSVGDGVAVVGVPGEYRATLALGGPPPLPPPPPPPNPGEAPPEPAALAPPPPLGGWLVKKIEMLAGARDIDDDATAEPRAFTLTKLEDRVLGERATARMAGMSPPPPAPPELVENGAEGITGLHRVGRDAALRLVAATIAEQTKRVALRGGAWHGGAVRVEPIKASDATAEKIPDAAEKIPAEKKHGKGEGIRVWFWLPGARQSVGAAGTRLAGVDVGSVEVSTAAAANDAAVAAGTVPRIELVYRKGVDAADGRIVARALVPEEKEVFGFSGSSEDATPRRESGESPTPPACAIESLPFDMSSVDVREVLADGVRAASLRRLRMTLAAIEEPCAAAGLAATLEPAATRPSGDDGDGDTLSGRADEDGWGASPRPAIVVRLTANGTTAQVSCDKRGGELVVVGVSRLASPAAAAALARTVRQGGIAALPGALAGLVRAALESELRAAMREKGLAPHPAPKAVFRAASGTAWPGDGSPPAAAAPVTPSGGGLFVAAFMRARAPEGVSSPGAKKGKGAAASGAKASENGAAHDVCLSLVRASRANPASTPGAATWAPLSASGALAGGDDGETPPEWFAFDAARVAESAAACAAAQRVAAQRLVVAEWLTSRGVPFSDTRPVVSRTKQTAKKEKGGISRAEQHGGALWHLEASSAPVIAFHAGEDPAAPARVEIALGGDEGIELTVRFPPGVVWYGASPGDVGVGFEWGEVPGAPAALGGGGVFLSDEPDAHVASVRYFGSARFAESEASAACMDAHRMLSVRAFASALLKHKLAKRISIKMEVVSCVVGVGVGRLARVAWSGPPGPGGGLAAACLFYGRGQPAVEDAVSEAARVGDVDAFVAALEAKALV